MDFNLAREIAAANAAQLERLGVWPVECAIPAFLLKANQVSELVADAPTTTLSFSDDDRQTYTIIGTFDLTEPRHD